MKKVKKMMLACCVLALIVSSLWIYWEWPMTMDTLIPEEAWIKVELRCGGVENEWKEVTFEDPDPDIILPQINAVRLNRAENRSFLDDQYFQIILYHGQPYPTMIYVGCTGRVQIARELDFGRWKCYEGGEDFYRWLQSYSRNLSAVFDMEK